MVILDSCPRVIPMSNITTTIARMKESDYIPNTNFHGMGEKVNVWFKVKGTLAAEAFLRFLDDVPDFSPKKCKAIQEQDTDREILLDDDAQHIYKFLENMKISFENHSHESMGYAQVSKQDQAWTIIGDDEYNETSIGELHVEERELSPSEREDLKRELPFLLHSVSEKISSFGFHFYSVIQAVYILNVAVTKRYYSVSELAGKVYTVNSITGAPDRLVSSQTPKLRDCVSWINGDAPDPAHSDFHKLLYTLRMLHIDPRKDDISKIDRTFIENLITDYITPNNQIVARNLSEKLSIGDMIDFNVRQLIYRTSLEEFLSNDFSMEDCLTTIQTDASHVIQLAVMDTENFPPNEEVASKYLNMLRNRGLVTSVGANLSYDDSGFAFDMQIGQRLQIDARAFCKHSTAEEHIAFLHISGNLLLLKDNSKCHKVGSPNFIYYLPLAQALNYICYKKPYVSPNRQVFDFGEWCECSI